MTDNASLIEAVRVSLSYGSYARTPDDLPYRDAAERVVTIFLGSDWLAEHDREVAAKAWDEAVAAIFAWWQAPADERPEVVVNPYAEWLSKPESYGPVSRSS